MIGMDGTIHQYITYIYIKHIKFFLQRTIHTNVDKHNKANKGTHRQPTTIQESNKPINQQSNNPKIQKSNKPTNKPQATSLLLFFNLHWSFQFWCWCHHAFCGEKFIFSSLVIATTINSITTRNATTTMTSNNHHHIDKRGKSQQGHKETTTTTKNKQQQQDHQYDGVLMKASS